MTSLDDAATINAYLAALPSPALERVRSTPLEQWCGGDGPPRRDDGRQCLVFLATGPGPGCGLVGIAFDALCYKDGLEPTVAAVKAQAELLLQERAARRARKGAPDA